VLKKFAAALSVGDIVGILGAAAVTYGAWLIFHPAGFIVGGLLLIAGNLFVARSQELPVLSQAD
jgi:hypothetical protein